MKRMKRVMDMAMVDLGSSVRHSEENQFGLSYYIDQFL